MSKWRKDMAERSKKRSRENTFIEYCATGNIDWVNEMLTHRTVDINVKEEEGFRTACYNGQLAVVKYLLTSPKLKSNRLPFANLHTGGESGLHNACQGGHLQVVKYLLTSPEIIAAGHTYPNLHAKEETAFINACVSGNIELVKYLLTSPDVVSFGYPNIHAQNDLGFRCACYSGHLDMVKYLTSSPELGEHANIHAYGDKGIINACKQGKLGILEYLIFELNLKLTPDINEFLRDSVNDNTLGNEAVLNMFQVSERYHALESSLEHKQSQKHKVKKI